MEPLRRAFRGYEPTQVDRLVSGLYSQLEARLEEIAELRRDNGAIASQLAALQEEEAARQRDEKAIQDALVGAHRQAENILAEARKEAETLLEVARETAARYQEDLRGRIDDLNWQIERLTLQRQRFQADFRALLESNLAQLAEAPPARPLTATPEETTSAPEADTPNSPMAEESSPNADSEPLEVS